MFWFNIAARCVTRERERVKHANFLLAMRGASATPISVRRNSTHVRHGCSPTSPPMKSKIYLTLLAACAALVAGCLVPSFHPLFEEKDLVAYSDIVGTWSQDGKDDNLWKFERDGKEYKLTHTDDKKQTATFEVLVGKIGTNLFLDVFPEDSDLDDHVNDLQIAQLVPSHTFLKLSKDGANLQLIAMDFEWLMKALEENPRLVSHVRRKDHAMLTAPTAELQKFVTAHAGNTNVFKNVITLQPKK
jgi:hypothetical protein